MTVTLSDQVWGKQAACRGLDPAIFYPVSDEEAGPAKAVCGNCAVQEACLEHALMSREARRRLGRSHREGAPPDPAEATPDGVTLADHGGWPESWVG